MSCSSYVAINQVLLALARILEINLWTLDELWWREPKRTLVKHVE